MLVKTFIRPAAVGALSYENGIVDKNDCTVRALANAASMPYTDAHATLKKYGRKNKHGCAFPIFSAAYGENGFSLMGVFGTTGAAKYYNACVKKVSLDVPHFKGMTVGRAIDELLQVGRYIVLISGHAFAVVNGKIFDTGAISSAKSVVAIYKLEEN